MHFGAVCVRLRSSRGLDRAARWRGATPMSVVRRVALLLLFAIVVAGPSATLGQGASLGSGHGVDPNPAGHDRGRSAVDPAAHHSLREPVTDQNFYFVMPDRLNNADAANDK